MLYNFCCNQYTHLHLVYTYTVKFSAYSLLSVIHITVNTPQCTSFAFSQFMEIGVNGGRVVSALLSVVMVSKSLSESVIIHGQSTMEHQGVLEAKQILRTASDNHVQVCSEINMSMAIYVSINWLHNVFTLQTLPKPQHI